MHLGKGEAEAIVLAKEKDALLIIDDRDGRGMASSLGIKVTGTVGLLKYAAENGRIDMKNTMEELMASGFRLSKSEYEKIIRGD